MARCVRVVVSGRVQGVYFRLFTQEEAQRLGLAGWVRNLATGAVVTLICGPPAAVEQMLAWLGHGSPASRVDHLEIEDIADPEPAVTGFTIRR